MLKMKTLTRCSMMWFGAMLGLALVEAPTAAASVSTAYTTQDLARALTGLFPLQWPVPEVLRTGSYLVKTSIDRDLQEKIDRFLIRHQPAYGAAAVIRPSTGEILCLSSYTTDRRWKGKNLALVGSFPAASVFKLVTAAGVLSEGRHTRLDTIPFVGARTAAPAAWNTKKSSGRGSHWVTLQEAFADSINPVFAKLGHHELGLEGLGEWAHAFGWGAPVTEQIDVEPSSIDLSQGELAAAKIGSGYTRGTTLSPLHGAALAATIVNGGTFIEPGVVSVVVDAQGSLWYRRPFLDGRTVLTPQVATELSYMMEATIDSGTAQAAYDAREGVLEDLIVGGKTGTLTGSNPAGRAHWLVGWAKDKNTGESLAFATLVVDGARRRGTTAKELSKQVLRCYFGRLHPEKEAAFLAQAAQGGSLTVQRVAAHSKSSSKATYKHSSKKHSKAASSKSKSKAKSASKSKSKSKAKAKAKAKPKKKSKSKRTAR